MSVQPSNGIRIVTVLGSVRPGNYTAKALAVVHDEIAKREDITLDAIDPAGLDLAPPGRASDPSVAKDLQDRVAAATALVLATPEYHGGFSSVIKLVIENLGFPSVMAGKPVALMGVAAGQIGAIKSLEQLRSVCSHVGAIVLPGPVSVANVQKVFDEDGQCLDPGTEKRLRGVVTSLIHYIEDTICPRVALEQMVRGGLD